MLNRLIIPAVVVALLVAAGFTFLGGEERKTLTAHFPRTVSLYEGSDVRVLGVAVGTVDSVTPSGTDVVVKISYEESVKIPSDAKAVIISPSVVGDRYVQLTPAYTGGEVLARRRRPWTSSRPRCRSSSTRSTTTSTSSTSRSAPTAPTARARSRTCSRSPPTTSAARASSSTRPSATSPTSARR